MSSQSSKSTQEFVPIKDVRDGIVSLKNGSMIAIMMASSLNFALKSADEQVAIISQFQNFLNSLDFSVQFYIQSRELDIRPYVATLEERYEKQTNDLMKIQTHEYIDFIKNFTQNESIMTKNFFIVVPYVQPMLSPKRGLAKIFGKKQQDATEESSFEENRTQLEQRMAIVEQGLIRCGVRVIQLGTEELIELFFKLFNPGDLETSIKLG